MTHYFSQPGLSNSRLSEFEQALSGKDGYDSTNAFRIGHLVDAHITALNTLDHIKLTIEDLPHTYTQYEWNWAIRARNAFFSDHVCSQIFYQSSLQLEMYAAVSFAGIGEIDCKCKYDGWVHVTRWGWDLKTTQATSASAFEDCVDKFNYDRAAYFYMEVSGSNKFCIFAINKKTLKIYKVFIERGDYLHRRGKDKCLGLLKKYESIYGL